MDVSIVVPAYNEASRLPDSLRRILTFFDERPWKAEVVVVVEPGTDDTLRLAHEASATDPRVRVLAPPVHRGKGAAVREGMLAACAEIRFFMDADLSTELAAMDRFLARFQQEPNIDVVIGNRQHPGSRIEKYQNPLRRSMGQMFNRLVQFLAIRGITDTQCGFKAFRAAAAEAIFSRQQMDGFAFDVETLLIAERLGFKFAELPVVWRNSAASKVRVVQDSIAMLRDILRARRLLDANLGRALRK